MTGLTSRGLRGGLWGCIGNDNREEENEKFFTIYRALYVGCATSWQELEAGANFINIIYIYVYVHIHVVCKCRGFSLSAGNFVICFNRIKS